MNEDSKNFVLFAVLAALILFGWPVITNHFFPAANPPATKIEGGKTRVVANPSADSAADGPKALQRRETVIAQTPRVRIQTPALSGSINLKGARIDDLVLAQYKETVAKDSPPIRLFSPSGSPDAYFATFGWSGDGIAAPGSDTVWTPDAQVLTPQRPVTLRWSNPTGQQFQLRIAVDDKFVFTVAQTVGNAGTTPTNVRSYALISRAGVPKDIGTWTNHVGPIGVFGSGVDFDISYENLNGKESGFLARLFGNSGKAGPNYFDAKGGWLGFGDKYWLAALAPDQQLGVHSGFQASGPQRFQADFTSQPRNLASGQAITNITRLFAGAKEVNTLDRYEDGLAIPHFGNAIDWGWFSFFEKPIFTYLDWLFRMVGNFGVAIILLTVTIRGLMFPIAQRQFRSMADVRAIQPKMKAIQERYKDDKARQQQEVMALYKAEKVNPLAGCLPTFLQIPIFYALYKVLMLTIEMRHQPFALWIRDLSAPDPLTPVNLFGLLPFDPPGFLHLGVLAILLGITMWFQFRLNPQQGDPTTQQVMGLMPWVMMFIFAPFAAGLQLYYVVSNLLGILQQRVLYARHPELKAAPAK